MSRAKFQSYLLTICGSCLNLYRIDIILNFKQWLGRISVDYVPCGNRVSLILRELINLTMVLSHLLLYELYLSITIRDHLNHIS